MKKSKCFLALLLALILTLAAGTTALATSGTNKDTEGTITVTTSALNNTYSLYKIFDLESFDEEKAAYVYKITSKSLWYDFVKEATDTNGNKYIKLTKVGTTDEYDEYTVEWDGDSEENRKRAFAAAALDYARSHDPVISPTKTGTVTEETGVNDEKYVSCVKNDKAGSGGIDSYGNQYYNLVFSKLELGYYLVDSTVGTLLNLNTTEPDAIIEEKNNFPTINKYVYDGSQFVERMPANIGDIIEFGTRTVVATGATNYILRDEMENSFKLDKDSFEVYVGYSKTSTSADKKKVETLSDIDSSITAGSPEDVPLYSVNIDNAAEGSDTTFQVQFTQKLLDYAVKYVDTSTNDIFVYYKAELLPNAKTGGNGTSTPIEDGNTNTAWVTFGDANTPTKKVSTQVYTYEFDLVKTKSGNGTVDILSGAQFRLYTDKTEGTLIPVVYDGVVDGKNIYHVADSAEQKTIADAKAEIEAAKAEVRAANPGKTDEELRKEGLFPSEYENDIIKADVATIKGLKTGKYYLEEIQAPNGYNKLTERITVDIEHLNVSIKTSALDLTDPSKPTYYTGDNTTGSSGGIRVINNSGSLLPSTGGIGTTVFYITGGVLVLGAAVFFVVRRKMKKEESA